MTEAGLPEEAFIAVLDELIPARNASLPGAGSLGVGEYVEARLGDTLALIANALAALDEDARQQGATGFADLEPEARASRLSEVSAQHPGFVESLVFHTYAGYYQDPRVAAALGMRPGPPHPEGYPLERGDLGLLDVVRERQQLYRDV